MIRLNLLPQLKKRELQREIFLRALFVLALFVVIWAIVFFLLVAQSWMFISIQNDALVERVRVEESAESAQALIAFEETTERANNMIAQVQRAGEFPNYDPVLIFDALSSLIPPGTSLITVDLNSDSHTLTINGTSPTREGVLLFEENLRNETDMFAEVISPLENILTPVDVNFSFIMTLK